MRMHAVIPAYNEAECIESTVRSIHAHLPPDATMTVVDDGSSDRTGAILDRLRGEGLLTVVRHLQNQGVRAAFESGLGAVLAHAAADDAVILLEANGTSDPALIGPLCAAIRRGDADVVIASRSVPGGGWKNYPAHRILLSRGCNALLSAGIGLPGVADYSHFYRAYRAAKLKLALDHVAGHGPDDFSFNAYLLLRFPKETRYHEIPFVCDYGLKRSTSKLKPGRTIRSYLTILASENRLTRGR